MYRTCQTEYHSANLRRQWYGFGGINNETESDLFKRRLRYYRWIMNYNAYVATSYLNTTYSGNM